jgi:hypothetical protein
LALTTPDPDWTALEAGIKPAVRIRLGAFDASRLATVLEARGAAVVMSSTPLHAGDSSDDVVLYVSRSHARAEGLRDIERCTLEVEADTPTRLAAHRELGRSLGYPACCVDAYVRIVSDFDAQGPARALHEDFVHARAALARTTSFAHARLNPLLLSSRIRLLTFYPCRYDCLEALEYVDAVYQAMKHKDPRAADELDAALACRIVLAPSGERALLSHSADGSLRAVAPTRPRGSTDLRGDRAFARSLGSMATQADLPRDLLLIDFRHRVAPERESPC